MENIVLSIEQMRHLEELGLICSENELLNKIPQYLVLYLPGGITKKCQLIIKEISNVWNGEYIGSDIKFESEDKLHLLYQILEWNYNNGH